MENSELNLKLDNTGTWLELAITTEVGMIL